VYFAEERPSGQSAPSVGLGLWQLGMESPVDAGVSQIVLFLNEIG